MRAVAIEPRVEPAGRHPRRAHADARLGAGRRARRAGRDAHRAAPVPRRQLHGRRPDLLVRRGDARRLRQPDRRRHRRLDHRRDREPGRHLRRLHRLRPEDPRAARDHLRRPARPARAACSARGRWRESDDRAALDGSRSASRWSLPSLVASRSCSGPSASASSRSCSPTRSRSSGSTCWSATAARSRSATARSSRSAPTRPPLLIEKAASRTCSPCRPPRWSASSAGLPVRPPGAAHARALPRAASRSAWRSPPPQLIKRFDELTGGSQGMNVVAARGARLAAAWPTTSTSTCSRWRSRICCSC